MCPVSSLRVVDVHFPASLSRQFSLVYMAAPSRLRPTRFLRSFGPHPVRCGSSLWSDRQLDRLLKEVDR